MIVAARFYQLLYDVQWIQSASDNPEHLMDNIIRGGLISLWLYKENNKLGD
jgi:hypothetical protein